MMMHLAHYLGLLHRAQIELGEAFHEVAEQHQDEPDVIQTCKKLAARPLSDGRRVRHQLDGDRPGRQGVRDTDLFAVVQRCEGETATQLKWLRTRMKEAAPQALIVVAT
jgi:hypothetical protein